MKISKHIHSCLLVEEQNKTILIDPGMYTYNEKALDTNSLRSLDSILITHEHFDHMHIPLIKELIEKFLSIQIITNPSAVNILKKEGITAQSNMEVFVTYEDAPHEKLMDLQPPQNYAFTLFDTLTHPGDSLHFTKTAEVLALPIQAPWGSMVQACDKALAVKPKVIIPIHDWHWKDEVRKGMYKRLTEYFKKYDIGFKGLETGEVITI